MKNKISTLFASATFLAVTSCSAQNVISDENKATDLLVDFKNGGKTFFAYDPEADQPDIVVFA